MVFCKEVRDKTKEENPNASFVELGRLIGEKWRALDPQTKQVRNRISRSSATVAQQNLQFNLDE
jgi:hypothetical protein